MHSTPRCILYRTQTAVHPRESILQDHHPHLRYSPPAHPPLLVVRKWYLLVPPANNKLAANNVALPRIPLPVLLVPQARHPKTTLGTVTDRIGHQHVDGELQVDLPFPNSRIHTSYTPPASPCSPSRPPPAPLLRTRPGAENGTHDRGGILYCAGMLLCRVRTVNRAMPECHGACRRL